MIGFCVLAFLAIVAYISPRPEEPLVEAGAAPEAEQGAGAAGPAACPPVATPGLLALGRALESYGRAASPARAGVECPVEARKIKSDRL